MMGPRTKPTGAVATSPTCGIVGIFDTSDDVVGIRQKARLMSSLQRHRGPDWFVSRPPFAARPAVTLRPFFGAFRA